MVRCPHCLLEYIEFQHQSCPACGTKAPKSRDYNSTHQWSTYETPTDVGHTSTSSDHSSAGSSDGYSGGGGDFSGGGGGSDF